MPLRIITWNVNSLRSAMRHGFTEWLHETKPDIVCLQEVRATAMQLRPLEPLFPDYRCIWHPAVRPGYSGTAVLSRFEPISIEYGLNGDIDPEGRSLTIDFGTYRVGSFYAPNAIPGTPKLATKCAWLERFRSHVSLHSNIPFFVTGDLNVAYTQFDSRGELHPLGMNGCTNEERNGFREVLHQGHLFDPIRDHADTKVLSTWWPPYATDRRPVDGLRLDYILLPSKYRSLVVDHAIHSEVFGSDHCPVSMVLDLSVATLQTTRGLGQIPLL